MKSKRITWANDDELRCCMLAALGFSTQFIMQETGLTACQVAYRLNKGMVKRADYRNGGSAIAQRVMERVIPSNNSGIRSQLNLKVIP